MVVAGVPVWVKFTKARTGAEARTYVQLVESYRDEKGKPRHRVLAGLGRADELDPDMIARLVQSLGGLTDRVAVVSGPEDIRNQGARVYGSTYVLQQIWTRLGLDQWWREVAEGRRYRFDLEAAIRAMVFSRLHNPASERKTMAWLAQAEVTGAEGLALQHLYRALDAFYHLWPSLEPRLLPALGRLVAVDASLCLFDTTSVHFEGEGPPGLAQFGYSRDRRPDCRQFILGLLTTREGVPIGHLVLPGNTSDTHSLVRAQKELLERIPALKPILVLDRGMVSAENLAGLKASGYAYIVGIRLREHKARRALARPGRYARVADNLHVKEVCMEGTPDRVIVCYNPQEAERDRRNRAEMVSRLRQMLQAGRIPKQLLRSAPARRYLNFMGGRVQLNEDRIREDEAYDGKWVLETNVGKERLCAKEVAGHYKGLWRVESAFRSLKSPLEAHPVYHWTERRVKAHVGVCVLAYALLRVLELMLGEASVDDSGKTALETLAAITSEEVRVGPLHFRVRSDLTPDQEKILQALRIPVPPKGQHLKQSLKQRSGRKRSGS